MKRWFPLFLVLLAGIAQVGALMPLALVGGVLLPQAGSGGPGWSLSLPGGGLSFLPLLLVWLGAWAIGNWGRSQRVVLTLLLLGGGLGLVWLTLLPEGRPASPLNPLFAIVVLPILVAAWWGGGGIGAVSLTWHSAFEGLRRSIWLCLAGLFILWLGAPAIPGAFAGPFVLFGAGLTLLFLLRLGNEAIPARIATLALAPLLLVALVAALTSPALVGIAFGLVMQVVVPVLQVVAIPVAYLLVLFQWLITLLRRGGAAPPPPPQQDTGEPAPPLPHVEPTVDVIQITAGFLVVIGLIALLYLIRRLGAKRRREQDEADPDEVRTGPGIFKGLLGDLRSLLGARRAGEAADLPPNHPRRLLRRLQAWGARQGRERQLAETPAQYAQALARQLPPAAEATGLGDLTAAYSATRYGSGSPNPQHVKAAERLLAELERERSK